MRRKLIESDEDDGTISDIKSLITIIDGSDEQIKEFDEMLFDSIVNSIIVNSQDQIRFQLIGGLDLTEPIERGMRA
jgi:hypothetical protein